MATVQQKHRHSGCDFLHRAAAACLHAAMRAALHCVGGRPGSHRRAARTGGPRLGQGGRSPSAAGTGYWPMSLSSMPPSILSAIAPVSPVRLHQAPRGRRMLGLRGGPSPRGAVLPAPSPCPCRAAVLHRLPRPRCPSPPLHLHFDIRRAHRAAPAPPSSRAHPDDVCDGVDEDLAVTNLAGVVVDGDDLDDVVHLSPARGWGCGRRGRVACSPRGVEIPRLGRGPQALHTTAPASPPSPSNSPPHLEVTMSSRVF